MVSGFVPRGAWLGWILMGLALVWGSSLWAGKKSAFFRADDVPAEEINEALGIELFQEEDFWQEEAATVAERLGWPAESTKETLASYRLYADRDARFMGVRPYSCAFYARDGRPEMISVVYANKGDFLWAAYLERMKASEDNSEAKPPEPQNRPNLYTAIKEDSARLKEKLTDLLGKPKREFFGKGSMREKVSRWDWNDVAFLLAAPEGEYVGLRILPADTADNDGVLKASPDSVFKKKLKKRILERPNGDVVITGIPMVDQGPKGYCVPATWERYLRFMDISADMYVLAMAAQTSQGGGTLAGVIDKSADDLAQKHKKRVDVIEPEVDIKHLQRYLDRGLPIMWTCRVNKEWDDTLAGRTQARQEAETSDWKDQLADYRKKAEDASPGRRNGHMRMIIGYNPKTQEIAITDSWGEGYDERWMTIEEAREINGGVMKIITP